MAFADTYMFSSPEHRSPIKRSVNVVFTVWSDSRELRRIGRGSSDYSSKMLGCWSVSIYLAAHQIFQLYMNFRGVGKS